MDVMEAIYARRAVRDYLETPVQLDVLTQLVAAATAAPSAINAQPWHFTIIRDQALLDRISAAAKTHMVGLIDGRDGLAQMRQHLTHTAVQNFYNSPALIVIAAKFGDWAVEDASLAAENLMLAACAQGLGTCWIGFAQRWLETDEGRRSIELASGFQAVAPIIVGHPRAPVPAVPRKPPLIKWLD